MIIVSSSSFSSSSSSSSSSSVSSSFFVLLSASIRSMTLLLLFVLLLLIRPVHSSFSISVPTGDSECYHIRVPSDARSIISGSYEILDEEATGTIVQVVVKESHSPNIKWTSAENRLEESFRVIAEPSKKYSLCFISVPNDRKTRRDRTPRLIKDDNEKQRQLEKELQGDMDDDYAKQTKKNNDNDEDEDDYDLSNRYVAEFTNVGFSLRWTRLPRSLEEGEAGPEALRAIKMVEDASYLLEDWEDLMDHFDFLRHREAVHIHMMHSIFDRLFRWTMIETVLVIFMAIGQIFYWRKFFEQRRYL